MPRQTIGGWTDSCQYCGVLIDPTEMHDCVQRRLLQEHIEVFTDIQEQRQERRQGRARKRRKIEELEERVARKSQEIHTLIEIAAGFRMILSSIASLQAIPGDHSNFGTLEYAITWARRAIEATPPPERRDRDA